MSDYLKFLENKARFSAWLIVLFFLLITIPVLLESNYKNTAKILGVLIIGTLAIALWFWRTQTIRNVKRKSRIRLNLNDRFWLNQHINFYKHLSVSDKTIFEDRVGLFLAEMKITEVGKEVPEKDTCLYVASSAVVAFWGLPYWNYGELSEVLVYPSNFTDNNKLELKGSVLGKVHHGGLMDSTMILSLPAVINGFSLNDGHNVGIHEFSHLLDKEGDGINGIPFMLSHDERLVWSRIVERELKKHDRNTKLNSYAFKNKDEFFAVLMETYRENPNRIKKKYPELHEILSAHFSE